MLTVLLLIALFTAPALLAVDCPVHCPCLPTPAYAQEKLGSTLKNCTPHSLSKPQSAPFLSHGRGFKMGEGGGVPKRTLLVALDTNPDPVLSIITVPASLPMPVPERS